MGSRARIFKKEEKAMTMPNASNFKQQITDTREGLLAWNQERAILDVTEMVCRIMKESGVSRSELANRLSKTKGYITQLLDGTANMTLRTVSDALTVLGYEFRPQCAPMETDSGSFHFTMPIDNDEPRDDDFSRSSGRLDAPYPEAGRSQRLGFRVP